MITTERIATRLAALQQQRAERQDKPDLPRTMTPRQETAYLADTTALDAKIAAIHTASATLAALGSVEALVRWRDFLTTARVTLCAERLTIKSPIRDREIKEHAQRLEWSIKLIDFGFSIAPLGIVTLEPAAIGPLMQQAGYATSGAALRGPSGWQGSLPEVEHRIKALTAQRIAAEAVLEIALRDDDAQAKLDAEHQTYRDALRTMTIRNGPDGTGLVAYDEENAPIDRATMTDVQQKALAWWEAAQRPREPEPVETVTS